MNIDQNIQKYGSSESTDRSQTPKRSNPDYERFETLLFSLSATFINLPPKDIDSEINSGLKLMSEFLNIDRSSLAQFDESQSVLTITHYHTIADTLKAPFQIVDATVPWFSKQMRSGRVTIIENIDKDTPKDAEKDREYLRSQNIKSGVAIPLKVENNILGCLFFTNIKKFMPFPEKLVNRLVLASEILAKALWRKQTELQIEQHRQFEILLSKISVNFVYFHQNELEDKINKSLKMIGEHLGADLLFMRQLQPEQGGYRIIYRWLKDGITIPNKEWLTSQDTPWIFNNLRLNVVCNVHKLDDMPKEADPDKELIKSLGIKSFLIVPFVTKNEFIGTMAVGMVSRQKKWSTALVKQLKLIGEIFSNSILRRRAEEKLETALSEIRELKEKIEAECFYLKEEIKLDHNFDEIIGNSDSLKQTLFKVEQVAKTDATVLILGDTGTGKELIARAVHHASNRKDRPFIKLNCATLPANLIESELFGHLKGAFSGAHTDRIGRFELADQATLFLDEIGELPTELQSKLLRVLQDGEFEKLGSSQTIKTDVRVITATNRDLEEEVTAGRFRGDLWYRLNVFPISVPSLADRKEDIPLLVNHFVHKISKMIGKQIDHVSRKTINALKKYEWPGNIRELENLLEREIIISQDRLLNFEIPQTGNMPIESGMTLNEMERRYIEEVLENSNWIIEGNQGACKKLGLKPSTLRNRLKKLGIKRPGA